MTQQYLSEIRILPFNFAPRGWAQCNGQLLSIQQNTALFALLGTFYGGNGVNTFALPNLQGRVPLGFSSTYPIGAVFGEPSHTLSVTETPIHNHMVNVDATTAATNSVATPSNGTVLGQSAGTGTASFPVLIYANAAVNTTLAPQTISNVGGLPHENRQPFLTLNFCIALVGIFPSRN